MTKLYKYRPLNDFLYKELLYQEIYFASYLELNDPLDLSARIEFTPKDENEITFLLRFILKTTLKFSEDLYSEKNKKIILLINNKESKKRFKSVVFQKISEIKSLKEFISIEDIEQIIILIEKEFDISIDINSLNNELKRLTKKFLENSYTTCFSETNKNFLMWSHYASKHSGICLEFSPSANNEFSYLIKSEFKLNFDKQGFGNWQSTGFIYSEKLRKVDYQKEQPFINFFEFYPVFENENDCDLIGLSKGWAHYYAHKLMDVFSTKTLPWKYEKEWRGIEINFGDERFPEDRINYYPLDCLTAIYFGIRTPEIAKKRIKNIFDSLQKKINYYDSLPTDGKTMKFKKWEEEFE